MRSTIRSPFIGKQLIKGRNKYNEKNIRLLTSAHEVSHEQMQIHANAYPNVVIVAMKILFPNDDDAGGDDNDDDDDDDDDE
jgi:hypothetical protein